MINIEITTTFDFGKLERNLSNILKHSADLRAETLATDARNMIKEGRLRNVTEGTMEIARKRLSKKRPYPRVGSKQQALLHTGNALASIKAIDGEVHAAGYLKYHMDGFTIASNSWTRKFAKKAIGKNIKPRNPFFTNKGGLRKRTKEAIKAHRRRSKTLHHLIAKALKK
tara:strand:+ start:7 stop:516 length:510 start_codon:yes stop_codon:yes gene_type:complete